MPKYKSVDNNLAPFSSLGFIQNKNCPLSQSYSAVVIPGYPPEITRAAAYKVFLVPKRHAMKAHGVLEVKQPTFMTLAFDGGKW
jgi:hypothetical protein